MNIQEIEETIEECKSMASENVFDLEKGHIKRINLERYVELLEELLRGSLKYISRLP
jgi:hypothetical protein